MTDPPSKRPSISPLDQSAAESNVFRQLIDAAPDSIVVVDESGRIVFVNTQTERLFGYGRDELHGQAVEILLPERYRKSHVGRRTAFTRDPHARPMGSGLDLFGRRSDGAEFSVEVSLSPMMSAQGRLVCAAIRDVSERKRIEESVKRAHEYLRNAIESFPGAFALFDKADALVMCNSTYRESFARALSGEVVARSLEVVLDAAIAAGTFELGEEQPGDFKARWRAYHLEPKGPFDVRTAEGRTLRVLHRRTSDGGTVVTSLDITDDVEHERELSAARAEAEAASSAKSEFLASMSHELRTPLNAILGFAQLLQRDKRDPLNERHLDRLAHVIKGGEHLLRLIDEVLDLSRIEAGRVPISLEPVDVSDVLGEVKTTLAPMADRAKVQLEILQVPRGTPRVIADRTRFAQVLMNFGSNAIKYGREGGKVRFGVEARGDRLRFTVADDGLGIPLEKQAEIFQPFHRAGQETGSIEGTGIGLTISRRLAEIMGGSVGFSSTPGEGSEFWIELGAAQADVAEIPRAKVPQVASGPLSVSDEGTRLVVYVEDNPANLAFMEDFFADLERIALLTAPTAEIGIELARARMPDVIIMDINLPGMSGLEAVQRLREWPETRDIPIVGLSAAAMVRDAKRVSEAGFYRYLTKPVNVDDLANVLDELLSRPRVPEAG